MLYWGTGKKAKPKIITDTEFCTGRLLPSKLSFNQAFFFFFPHPWTGGLRLQQGCLEELTTRLRISGTRASRRSSGRKALTPTPASPLPRLLNAANQLQQSVPREPLGPVMSTLQVMVHLATRAIFSARQHSHHSYCQCSVSVAKKLLA